MNTATLAFARSSARPRRFAFDGVLIMTVGALLLLGLVMMTSASVTIADRQTHEPLHYLERQSVGIVLGLLAAMFAMAIPTRLWERLALPLLLLGFLFLVVVLIPGIGYEVNGSRRWLRAGFMNFQASELARVVQLALEYSPQPPFRSGTPEEATPQTLATLRAAWGGQLGERIQSRVLAASQRLPKA